MAEDNSKKYLDKAGLSAYTQQLKNKLDETYSTIEYVDSVAVQPDWNQNDETQSDYIKNRICYTTDPQPVSVYSTTLTTTNGNFYYLHYLSLSQYLIEGNEYVVEINGVQSTHTVKPYEEGSKHMCLGNAYLYNTSYPDTGELFCITAGSILIKDTGEGQYEIKLCEMKPVDVQIDVKYLQNKPGLKTAEGGEIFNYSGNTATGTYSHAEGISTTASGDYSHAEGEYTTASGDRSHAEGEDTTASGENSHAEGEGSTASGSCCHAEGNNTTAEGMYSHAEGYRAIASGYYNHAEGDRCEATGGYGTHAEGYMTYATGYYGAHAEGGQTLAEGESSHAEGYGTKSYGRYSHAEGRSTIARGIAQHTEGQYNIEDTEERYAHIVGNGTGFEERSNAHTLDWDGNAWFAGDVYVGGTSQDTDSKKLATEEYVDDNKFSGDYNDLTNVPIKLYEEELITLSENYTEFVLPTTYGMVQPNGYYYANRTSSLGLIEDQLYRIEIYNRETDELLKSEDVTANIDEYFGESPVICIYTDLLDCIIADDSYFDASASNESSIFVKQTGNSAIVCIYYEDFCNVDIKIFKKELIKLNNELLLDDVSIQNSLAIGTSKVTGSYSYAEGCESEASSYCSHAEGDHTLASGVYGSHAEGYYTIASGANGSHAEGKNTTASGNGSHAEGCYTIAAGSSQHVQGKWNIEDSAGIYAHIVGNGSGTYHTSTGTYDRSNAHTLDWNGNAWFAGQVEGTNLPYDTKKAFELTFDYSTGYSDIWGSMIVDANIPEDNLDILNNRPKAGEIITISYNEQTYQMPVIVNGESVYVGDDWAFSNETSDFGVGFYEDSISFYVKGESNIPTTPVTVTGAYDTVKVLDEKYIPYAAGRIVTGQTFTFNDDSTEQAQEGAEIFNDYSGNIATGKFSHAEGQATIATGSEAHAEGCITTASGENSHAEGLYSEAIGPQSHAEGLGGIASGNAAHAEGAYTKASGRYQHVEGTCNIEDTENKYIHIAGNGEVYPLKRSNAYTLDWNGNGWFAGNVSVGADNKQLATEEYVDDNIANAKSDWFTSDETDPSYVKNRTHWKEITKEILVDTETLNASFVPIAPTNGETVYVNLNGTQYECVASGDKDTMTVGDSSYATVPFNFVFDRYGDQYIPNLYLADGYTVEVFEMSRDKEEYHKISENYLPERALLGIRGEGEDSVIFNYYNKELNNNVADGSNSFAQGYYARATGETSHAEGNSTLASGRGSHAEGYGTVASGTYSHAEGDSTIAASFRQHAEGRYNIEDTADKYAHIVGNGSQAKRANAYTLDWSGNAWYQGNVSVDGTPTNDNDLTTKKYVDDALNNFVTEEELDAMLADIYGTTE